MDLLNIGRTGLAAANLGMATTSHNIANANTKGYSRQQITQQAMGGGDGLFSAKGVSVVGVERLANQFLIQQANVATSEAARSNTQLDYLNRISDLLTNEDSSIPSSVNRFFAGVQDLASRPSSQTERQTVLARAQSMAQRFNDIDANLQNMSSELNQQISAAVNTINGTASGIVKLNEQIALQLGNGIAPNDLLDQRDQLIRDLSGKVKVSIVDQPDGRINVFLASGDPLVTSNGSSTVLVQADPYSPGGIQLAVTGSSTGGAPRGILTSVDLGGSIGGFMSLQSDLSNARNENGRLAIVLATQINDQQALGQDLNGQPGAPMFSISNPTVVPVSGSGLMTASIADVTALKASDYRVDFDGSNYVVTRLSDSTQTSFATLPISLDGLSFSAGSPAPVSGQTFIVQAVREGASELRSILTDTNRVAAALPVNGVMSSGNAGTASIQSLSVDGPPPRAATLLQPVDLTFTSSTTFSYTVNGGAAQVGSVSASGEISINGWTMKISGTPSSGDHLSVTANTNASGDNRNLLLMGRLPQTPFVDGKTVTETNGIMIGNFGNRAAEMAITARANDSLLRQAEQQQSEVSGVNLDEEAANLMRYQQAYQAAAKAMSTAASVFDIILSLGSR